MLKEEEIKLAKYRIPISDVMTSKNENWLEQVSRRHYKNQHFLEEDKHDKKIIYGLEAESISSKRLKEKLEKEMVPLLGKTENLLQLLELKKLDKSLSNLIVHKVKWGEI
jgi:hypothetical protein